MLTAAPDAAPPTTARNRTSVRDRLRKYGDSASPRIIGLDVARAFAILGMIAAHSLNLPIMPDPLKPTTWVGIVNGNSAGLFAVLAGVSMAIMTGGRTLPSPEEMPAIRLRMLGRGAVLFVLGLALEMLNTPIAIILTSWGLLYIVVLPFVRVRRRRLAVWAVGLAVVAPAGMALIQRLFLDPYSAGLELTVAGTYPVHVWIALMLFGMILGRSDLRARRVQLTIAGAGLAGVLVLFGLGAGISVAASSILDSMTDSASVDGSSGSVGSGPAGAGSDQLPADSSTSSDMPTVSPSELDPSLVCEEWGDGSVFCSPDSSSSAPGAVPDTEGSAWPEYPNALGDIMDLLWTVLAALLSPMPHAGSTVEMVIIASVSSTVLGLCLLAGRPLRWPLLPLAALGSMPLTVYVLHVVLVFLVAGPTGAVFAVWMFALLTGVCVGYALLWWLFMGRGPLERLAGWASQRAAQ